MSKTPVSMLQEMMVKKLIVPNYELIHDGGGTHNNSFTYRVSCDGFCASGTGRCKKDAKHKAAKAMLETIAAERAYPQLPASPIQSPARTPLPQTIPEISRIPPDVPFVNAIGILQDFCGTNNLQNPVYTQINDVGPPHAKVFTIQCAVATFTEVGIAGTKKQAKHEAAKKMFDKLTDIVPNINTTFNIDSPKVDIHASIGTAKSHYLSISKTNLQKKVNLGIKLSNYDVQLKNELDNDVRKNIIEQLEHIKSDHYFKPKGELFATLQTIFKSIDLDISVGNLQSCIKNKYIVIIHVYSSPDITEIGVSDTQELAELDAIINLVETVLILLS